MDIKEYPQYLKKLRRNVQYSMRYAANTLAFGSRPSVQGYLRGKFTIRKQWILRGVRVRKATSIVNPISYVYHRDEYLVKQQFGGTERARGNSHKAIPRDIRKSYRQSITKSKRPLALKGKKGIFKTSKGIFKRTKRGVSTLFLLVKQTKYKKRISFEEPVDKYVRRNYGRVFQKAMDDAVRRSE